MNATIERLQHWIKEVPARLANLSEHDFSERPQPHKWSKKEILGHLCDSALTNIQRFVRAQYESQPYVVLKYAQNQWVEHMNYQNQSVSQVLNLWIALNTQALSVITTIPEDRLMYTCDIGEGQIVTLEWLIKDYVEHLEHHLGQIFGP
ncbi:DinB family protein [Paenibacillus guangzhouensis]|uniref:DinB family protein n=1 Tax=Paenibacillus guangzhouensis TaxID=1473112 RepID=UPI00126778CF|nr:DinB family protein [Paenibacillus guangzhouensis]